MSQIALPLVIGGQGPARIVVGNANRGVFDALATAESWPFRTAVLSGPRCAGKSLIARWFAEQGRGEVIDDADQLDETALFHRWNRAQESAVPLLLTRQISELPWEIALPDLRSRIGAALQLKIGTPDDAMLAELLALHAETRRLPLGPDAISYLAARAERSHLGAQQLIDAIDRISLERKVAPTMAIWREALDDVIGPQEPRLI